MPSIRLVAACPRHPARLAELRRGGRGAPLALDVAYMFYIMYRQSPLGPVDLSFRALPGRLKFKVRRHDSNTDFSPAREISSSLFNWSCGNRPGGNPGANSWFLKSTPIQMPP